MSLRELTDFLTALLFYDFLYFLSCWLVAMADMAVVIVSLYLAGKEKPIARYKTRVKVAEENNLFSSFQKKHFRVSWAQWASSKVRLGVIWPEIFPPDENQWQSGELRHINKAATLASTADFNQVEEYESDSDDSDNDADIQSEELVIGKPIMTRSGRQVKVWTRFVV